MGATYTRQSSYTDGDTITAAHTNDEFNQLLAAFAASTGHTHDGTAGEGGSVTTLLGNTLSFGDGTTDADIVITFNANNNDGVLSWKEDEDYFEFSDDILLATAEKLQFRDTAIYINSSTDGQLDLVADSEIQLAATTIDINGNVDISGTLTIGGAGISEAELEVLDGATVTTAELNIMDGDTSASATTVVDADRVVFNDDGTMKQVAVTDLAAYFDDEITAMPNLVTTAATTVGALNSGSITSGFGTIDTGSSTITTTGLISGGSLDIDDVLINGATIGHTDDTDLITLANGVVTVAGEISVTTLDIGGTNVTATAAELNILDGVTSTAAELNILDGVTSTTAELNILDGVTSTTAELNILDGVTSTATELSIVDGDTSATSTTVVDADRVVLNDNGTMVQVAVTDLAAYFDDEITAMPNLVTTAATTVGALNSGSITSGFGTIDTGSSTITTTGLISGGSLDIDNVLINGTTIGHTDDTDLITLADGLVTVAGEISVTTLDIGGTNVTATGAELNILDGVTSTAAELNILDGVTSTTAELNILDGVTSTAAELNILDGVTSTTAELNILDGVTSTTAELNILDGVTSTAAELNILDGVTSTTAELNILDGATVVVGEINALDLGSTAVGTAIASKAMILDSNKDYTGVRNFTLSGELDAGSLDVSGNADIDGTLEADAITVNGTALNTVIAGVTVANATLAATTTVTNSTANTNFPVVFHDESDALLDDTGALRYNPSTGTLLVPNLSVAGTTTTVDTVTMQAANAIIFEGATADANETTLSIVDPTDDRTINLPNQSGTLPVLAVASNTAITSTPEELNTLDGITAVVGELNALDLGSTAVGTAIASKAMILDSNKDYTGVRNFTLSGELDAGSLDISGNADIDGTLEADAITVNGTALATVIAGTTVTNATNSAHVLVTDNESTNEENLIAFVEGATSTTGNVGLEMDGTLTYNPSSGTVTATVFKGNIDAVDGDFDGTLEADAISIGGTTITSTAAELNILDGVTSTTAELNILDGVTSTTAELNILDGVTSTAAELNILDGVTSTAAELNILDGVTSTAAELNILDGVTSTAAELNILDGVTSTTAELNALDGITAVVGELNALDLGSTAVGTAIASKAMVLDSNKDYTGVRNFTLSGELDAGSLDISGDVDVDGTLETDALSIAGTAVSATAAELNILDGVTTTAAEINLIDGGTARGTTAVADGDGVLINDAGTMRMTKVDTLSTYMSGKSVGGSNIVTTGALNSGSITSGFGAINNGESAITTTGTITFGSISDGTITATAFVDEDNMASDSATLIPTQQSVKAYVDANVASGAMTSFQLEDDDGTEVTINNAKELKIIGSGVTTNFTDTSTGSNADPFDLTITVDAAQTGITSVKNASLAIGRDNDNLIKFSTDNQIIFEVAGGDNVIFKASGEIEASSLDISGDVDVDGTLETDAISIAGTAITSTAAELNILDGVTSTAAELNILDGVTSTAAELNILDGVTSTAAELNILDGVTSTAAELNVLDGITAVVGELNALDLGSTAVGTAIASKAMILDSNKDYTGVRNFTLSGELDAGSLDVSGNADIDGTLEADAITVNGTALNTVIAGVTVTNATNSAHVLVTDNENTNEENLITFVEGATSSTGNVGLEMDGNFAYNPSTGTVTATIFKGNIDAVDGDFDGTLEADAISIGGTTITSTAAELNALDGITAVVGELNALDLGSTAVGTAIASKAMILDSNKDYTGVRNFTLSGELDAGSLDISGNADIDGTLETDALSINGTAVTSTAAELNILDGVTSTTAELNILDGVTSTAAELNILDGVTSTAAELNILDGVTSTTAELNVLDGITAVVGELNALDLGSTAVGTAIASKAMILDSNKDYTGVRNFTLSGELDAGSLDISGDADIDGTLEADAITVNGTTLAEVIADTTGAMFSSNTETGITVTYQDADNTIDVAINAAQTTITSLLAADIKIGEDDQTKIDFETADEIHFYAANVEQVYLGDNIFGPQSDSDVDLGSNSVRWKDAYVDSATVTGDVAVGDDITVAGRASGHVTADNDGSFDLAVGNDFKCTPTGNFTLTFTNPTAGQSGNVMLVNSGGHTVSAHASVAINATILTALTTAGTYHLAYYCSADSGNDTILVSASAALS